MQIEGQCSGYLGEDVSSVWLTSAGGSDGHAPCLLGLSRIQPRQRLARVPVQLPQSGTRPQDITDGLRTPLEAVRNGDVEMAQT